MVPVVLPSLLLLAVAYSDPIPFNNTYNIAKASEGAFHEEDAEIVGYFPGQGQGPFPLFVMFPGTGQLPSDDTAKVITIRMAQRGYAAVAVQYPNYTTGGDTTLKPKARTVAASNNTQSAFSVLCAHSNIECDMGIAVLGYSQGALLTVLAADYNRQITAAFMQESARPDGEDDSEPSLYAICDDIHIASSLPKHKRRYVMGSGDQYFAWPTPYAACEDGAPICPTEKGAEDNLKLASGYDCGSTRNCLQSDGSGYYVTTTVDTGGPEPDHFNWMSGGKAGPDVEIASWYDTADSWAFPASLDWLAAAAATSPTVLV